MLTGPLNGSGPLFRPQGAPQGAAAPQDNAASPAVPAQLGQIMANQSPAERGRTLMYYRQLVSEGSIDPKNFSAIDFMYKASAKAANDPGGGNWQQSVVQAANGVVDAKDLAWTKVGLNAQRAAGDARKEAVLSAQRHDEIARLAYYQEIEKEALQAAERRQVEIRRALNDDLNLSATLSSIRSRTGL